MITVSEEPDGTSIRVDGWLAGDGVAELVRVLDSAVPPARLFVHDLRGVDAAGLSVLSRLAGQGISLDGLSPYLQLTLASPASLEPLSPPHVARSETPVRREES